MLTTVESYDKLLDVAEDKKQILTAKNIDN